MCFRTSSLIKLLWLCLLLVSFVTVICAADDSRFTLKDGVINDSETGLQWVPAPERPMNHYQAAEYANTLRLAGGGWRLPTNTEVKRIYDKSKPGGADPKFQINGHFVWTSEMEDGSNAAYFLFGSGGADGYAARDTLLPYIRVLAVRSRR
jgi:hypothetical protein